MCTNHGVVSALYLRVCVREGQHGGMRWEVAFCAIRRTVRHSRTEAVKLDVRAVMGSITHGQLAVAGLLYAMPVELVAVRM